MCPSLLIVFVVAMFANSKYIHISLTGNITTLKTACSQVEPGDVIEFSSGIYPPQEVPRLTNGTADHPIIIRAALNAAVTFQTFTGSSSVFKVLNSSNIIVEGPFTVRSGTGYSVSVQNSTNVTLSNFKIYNSTNWAMFASGVNIVIKNNYAEDCVMAHENCKTSSWMQCFVTGAIAPKVPILSRNITIENNEITKSWGEGIDIILCTDCTVINNYLHDVFPIEIYIDNAHNVVVENNTLKFSNQSICPQNMQYHAIAIGNEDWPEKVVSTTNITIRNNFIWGSGFGVGYWGWSDVAYYSDIVITQNTFVNVYGLTMGFQNACLVKGKSKNNQFKNNFVYTTYKWYAAVVNETEKNAWNISDNVYYGGYAKIIADSWNGSDGNAHSIHFRENDTAFSDFFKGGYFGNCSNESYYNWKVEKYCFIPHKESVLYHKGVYAKYSHLDGKLDIDGFDCARNEMKPSIGMSEGGYACNLNKAENVFVGILVVLIMIII
ncbi:hypothetical protein EIN_043450 [Entamoeba invadens IP1]|uniref:Right handed beta helix domain-containing protein n=1 Tax=Entamoeba invadens IP1 TaxID=370355 RepID=A0A0A1TZ42_ENTIV|nr:hypothetical protein EIN_043450 [Entamoeba invadens IP1]ELP86827.1 hypothetical protein EIN_043450 [Entamoeba invadens IP1]|eukprot:XP_004253598.1 hypothetical protein EIN_043450 [Entamoeba invadens IP1]